MRKLTKTFQALSDTNRIRILKMLEVRPLCVCEIAAVLQLANSTVSKHLSILRDVDFILDEKVGKWVNYYLNNSEENGFPTKLLPLISEWIPDDKRISEDRTKVNTVDRKTICGR